MVVGYDFFEGDEVVDVEGVGVGGLVVGWVEVDDGVLVFYSGYELVYWGRGRLVWERG